jgi:HEAT repeat protein
MSRESLGALSGELRRLLASGERAAALDRALRQRARALAAAAAKVPALAPVADAARRVLGGTPAERVRGMLDLNLLLGMAQAAVTTAGAGGAVEPAPPSGPWATDLRLDEPVFTGLVREPGNPGEDLWNTLAYIDHDPPTDLRLVEPLLRGLEHGDAGAGERIARDLLPLLGASVAPDLRRAFDAEGGRADAWRLMALCKADREAGLVACREALGRGSNAVRRVALEGLPDLDAAEAERAALAALADRRAPEGVREAALKALRVARSDAALVALFAAADSGAEEAREALVRCPHPQAGARLRELAREAADDCEGADGAARKEYAARAQWAMDVLIGRKDREGVRGFLRWLDHPAKELREWARDRVERLYDAGGPVVPELAALLPHKDTRVLRGAMDSLARAGEAAAAAVPALAGLLRDKRPGVRVQAAESLGGIGVGTREAVAALGAALGDGSRNVQVAAAVALGQLGATARAAVPALAAALKDQHADVRENAAIALGEIGPAAAAALPALVAARKDPSESVSHEALVSLGRLGRAGVPLFISTLRDPARCGDALEALDRHPAADRALVREVAVIVRDPAHPRREQAFAVLGSLGAAAKPGVPALVAALSDEADEIRAAAAEALWRAGPAAAGAVSALTRALKDRSPRVREYAAWALGAVGPEGRDAIPALREALADPEPFVRHHARRALRELARSKGAR